MYEPTDRDITALAKFLGYGTARILTESGAFRSIIQAADHAARADELERAASTVRAYSNWNHDTAFDVASIFDERARDWRATS